MATRTRRTSGSRKSSSPAATPSTEAVITAGEPVTAVPAAALKNAVEGLAALGKAQLTLQVDTALAVLRRAQALRKAQLQANQQAQTSHEQVAGELESANNINDIASLQLSLARDNLQGALSYWAQISEFTSGSVVEGWARAAESLSRLNASLLGTQLQWMHISPLDSPKAVEELEASVDHVVNPVIASPMLWPAQEAAREAMTFATSALNDWFAWSSQFSNGGATDRDTGSTVH